METSNRVSFGIYKANGTKKDGLRKNFVIVDSFVPVLSHYTLESDGSVWPLYYEDRYVQAGSYHANVPIKFIISFQLYEDGEYFAVARIWKERNGIAKR